MEVAGITFRRAGKVYYFSAGSLELNVGDTVVVETVRGVELARVVFPKKNISENEIQGELRHILRLATQQDLIEKYKNRLLSYRALKICKRKIRLHELEMKLVDVEYSIDGSKIIFYFSADGRIDFRNLVKELAAIFKKRIELHQIGVRDEAKILGGIGPCGRAVCCNVFMPDFAPVSIKMAKEQNLSLNPERISGACGRFMCCLKHEYEVYHEASKKYPSIGSIVQTPDGSAKVVDQYIAKGALLVENQVKGRFEVKFKDISTSKNIESPEKAEVEHPKPSPPVAKVSRENKANKESKESEEPVKKEVKTAQDNRKVRESNRHSNRNIRDGARRGNSENSNNASKNEEKPELPSNQEKRKWKPIVKTDNLEIINAVSPGQKLQEKVPEKSGQQNTTSSFKKRPRFNKNRQAPQ